MGTARAPSQFIGLNKGGHDASVCVLDETRSRTAPEIQIFLKERIGREKNAGILLHHELQAASNVLRPDRALIGENSYLQRPAVYEERVNRRFPYFSTLQDLGLTAYSSKFNRRLKYVPHHYAHALSAVALSPFRRSLILVMDGSGSAPEAFPKSHPEIRSFPPPQPKRPQFSEWLSVYLQDGPRVRCVEKRWQRSRNLVGGINVAEGLGMFYETSAVFIFNSGREAGKVMGLAAYGDPSPVDDPVGFWRAQPWSRSFKTRGKAAWERSGNFRLYADLAASVQSHYEQSVVRMVRELRKRFPDVENLILTGGCALNCLTNAKLLRSGFERIYVPPFPNDDGISLGVATHLRLAEAGRAWAPVALQDQRAFFGPKRSVPRAGELEKALDGMRVTRLRDPEREVARLIARGKVIAWFEGRSEVGPRALGHRSIYAHPGLTGMKDRLNRRVKGRESFRPYGASCLLKDAPRYFEVDSAFHSPFMSFAPRVRATYRDALSQVTHADGTCRIQTVTRQACPSLHRLLIELEKATGVGCVLHTSMNEMGEPIVETIDDARRFLERVPVDGLVIGSLLVQRRGR